MDSQLVVTSVKQGSEAEYARIVVDDQLVAWRYGDTSGNADSAWTPLWSPLDIAELELLGDVERIIEIRGLRDGEPTSWVLRAGVLGITAQPTGLAPGVLSMSDESIAAACADEPGLRGTVKGSCRLAAWVLTTQVMAAIEKQDWESFGQSSGQLALLGDSSTRVLAASYTLEHASSVAPLSELETLVGVLEGTLSTQGIAASTRVFGLIALAQFSADRGQSDAADQHLNALAAQLESVRGYGYARAKAAVIQGEVAWDRGQFDTAEERFKEALRIADTLPGRTDQFRICPVRGLGNIAATRGALTEAESYFQQSRQYTQTANDEIGLARALNALGIVSSMRGDMYEAEYNFQQALIINERKQQARGINANLFNLADIAYARRDFLTAIPLLERVVENFRALSPDSTDLALSIAMLAHNRLELGDLEGAESDYAEALAIYEQVAPKSYDKATVLLGIGDVALARGDADLAVARLSDALAILERRFARSPRLAEVHQYLALAYKAAGDRPLARRHLETALRIREKVAPLSVAHAETLHLLALADREDGHVADALAGYELTVSALESQVMRLGGADSARSRFMDAYSVYFKEYVDLLLDAGQTEKAFNTLERYRARALLAMLAERDQSLQSLLPVDLAEERREREREYETAQATLTELADSDATAQEVDAALDRVVEARLKRDGLTARLHTVASDFSRLRYPQPLDLAGAQRALSEGTLALSYSVGPKRTVVFAISRDTFQMNLVDLTEDQLRREVRRLIYLMDAGRHDDVPSEGLLDLSALLYDRLVAPAVKDTDYDRLLLVPDGPLHSIPFAALIRRETESGDSGSYRYLIEDQPLHRTLSFTLYAELQERSIERGRPGTLVAFADPEPGQSVANPIPGNSVRAANALTSSPLPWSRAEVEQIGKHYPGDVRLFTGASATEQAFKEVAPDADVVHIAAHALVDELSPMDSALLLSPSKQNDEENGLLQTWEIFEHVRLRASLVVLSACRSAMGREASGEGLLGLKRAFQFAGARTVMASLWIVSDHSTSVLMRAFYTERQAGHPVDVALQRAQLALLHRTSNESGDLSVFERVGRWFRPEPEFSHPYYWSAFHVSGDHEGGVSPQR